MMKRSIVILLLIFLLLAGCTPPPATRQPVKATSTEGAVTAAPTQATTTTVKTKGNSPSIVPTSTQAGFITTEILGRPTADSITISLYSKSDTRVVIKYGTSSGNYTSQTPSVNLKAAVPQNVELTSLATDTAYYYQVISDGSNSSEHTFHTQRAPGDTFTFTIDADPHYSDPSFNGPLYEITMNNALAAHPDFHIDLGDTFMTEKHNPQSINDDVGAYVNMRSYFGILASDAPLFLVNGNHDGELGWLLSTQRNEPIWATQLRQLYYPNPSPNGFYSGGSVPDPTLGTVRNAYYAWTWGDVLFIVLDPFWYSSSKPDPNDLNTNWNYTLGKTQYDWLKSTLESNNAKFKFVFIHNLVGGNDKDSRGGIEAAQYFEWGGENADGTYGFDQHRPGWEVPIHQLLVQNHVSAVFHGHDHVFVEQELDGIIYQECPQPSITKYDNTGLATQYGYIHGNVLSSSGYLRLTVTPDQVTVEYIRSFLPQDVNISQQNGEVAYKYVIK